MLHGQRLRLPDGTGPGAAAPAGGSTRAWPHSLVHTWGRAGTPSFRPGGARSAGVARSRLFTLADSPRPAWPRRATAAAAPLQPHVPTGCPLLAKACRGGVGAFFLINVGALPYAGPASAARQTAGEQAPRSSLRTCVRTLKGLIAFAVSPINNALSCLSQTVDQIDREEFL